MKYILSLDQGTTSSRAILFDETGQIVEIAQQEFRQIYSNTGWVEHDPYEILTSQLSSAVEALGRAGARPRDVAGLGITNQRETTIVWNRESGRPIYNAIVWQDRRTAPLCSRLTAEGAEGTIRSKTGLIVDPYFSGTKISWLLDNIPGARQQAEQGKLAFGTVDSWLIWNLTSGKQHVTDRTNASRTMLYNIVEDKWDADLLKLLNVPESMMPEVVWSSEKIGRVTTTLGLGDIEIAGLAGDQQSALFGHLCTRAGDAKCTYGTGCFLLQNAGEQFALSSQRLLTTLTCSPARKLEYALEGSIFIGGAVVQWMRDNMKFIAQSPDIEALAKSAESSNGVFFVPAFTGLGAPWWDPNASGLIIGLQRGTEIGHIARAALESIAFQVADVLKAMDRSSGKSSTHLRVDGGAASNDLLMQFQADLLGIPLERPAVFEATALGAAYLAGLATGFWPDVEALARKQASDMVFRPRADSSEMARLYAKWLDAVGRAKAWNTGLA